MLVGKIVRFDRNRGYGFIAPDSGGEDVFVHANDLDVDEFAVAVGTRVEFEVIEGERGPKAYAVHVLDKVPTAVAAVGVAQADNATSVARPAHGASPSTAANGTASSRATNASDIEDECEVLSEREFTSEVTELLLTVAPTLTGAQIVGVREALSGLARSHGWVD
jgi:CspA family cold shock protein